VRPAASPGPGAVIGVADIDTAAAVIEPSDPWLAKSFEVSARLRSGDPRTGRRLRGLLHEAGFRRCTVQARAFHHGDPAETKALADFNESWYATPEIVERIVSRGLATRDETAAMSAAWAAWGRRPDAFYAGLWCDALAFAD
jgi:hypothetical protein